MPTLPSDNREEAASFVWAIREKARWLKIKSVLSLAP